MIPPLEKTMFASFNSTVESAYIIRLEGNDASEGMAQRCANSCDSVGMPWKYHQAFDVMMQNSQFCIMQIGLYAYQVTGESTIR